MSQQVQLMELLKKEVRSQLLAAKKGLTPAQLEKEYLAMVGKPLPLRDLGFSSTMELVASMPGVVQICRNKEGGFLLKAVADETTKDIAKLISRQKTKSKARSAARKQSAPFLPQNQRGLPPKGKARVLPAAVKRELQDLLSSSPILLSDFNDAFYTRFKRTFQYTQYGFFSIFEVFESMSDIITVKETSRGFLLTLKKNSVSGIEQKKMPPELMAELPPLEPTCETEIFHQAEEEKSEPVDPQAVGLGDGLKQGEERMNAPSTGEVVTQHGDLEQSRLEIMMVAPDIPPDAVQDRRLCSFPPLETRCLVGVTVSLIVSPSEFYIHVCSAETYNDKLWGLMMEMRRCYSYKLISDRYIMPESSVRPGQLCCAMVSRWWYRVIIHRIISDQEVEVFYPDYGDIGIVQKSCLRFLKWRYLKLPAQAIPCSLARVKPVEDTWTSEATLQFQELCNSKVLVGIVGEYVNGILHLFLCDTSSEEDVYIHSVLKDKGYADICEESFYSQGFKELNPLALYVQSSAKQESAELVEPDLHLQQDSLGADNKAASFRVDEDELCNQQQNLCTEENWDDVQPLPDEVNDPKTTDQDCEFAQEDTNKTSTDLMAVVKTPHPLGESLRPTVFFKPLEDYFSFFYVKQPAEMSQNGPNNIEGFSNKAQACEVLHASLLLMAAPFMLDNHNNDEKMKNKDLPENLALVQRSAGALSEHEMSQKLYVPPTALSAVLAAPARLATCHGYFHWLPDPRKKL